MTIPVPLIGIPLLFGACFAGLGFVLVQALREGARSYSDIYASDTSRQLADIFLFIPAKRVLDVARITAIVAFAVCFLAVGDLTSPRGLAAGAAVGLLAAFGALNAPQVIVRVLRQRRRQRFNEQLVDSLLSMSNALKAGFSIMQAFETVVKEGRNPIAQEYGLFLHQTRVGVPFEEALQQLGERVGSEDLTLMINAIEIARRAGGNLTEVFDKIAATIRERLRIEGRIRSLTAMGRLQGIIVGAMPALLLLALSLWEPKMMASFFSSLAGMVMLGTVLLLEIAGYLVIRRIVNINI